MSARRSDVGDVAGLIVAQEFKNLDDRLMRSDRALRALWGSLSPIERHCTPLDVVRHVVAVIEEGS